MCEFIKVNGDKCKISPKKDLCHIHAKNSLVETIHIIAAPIELVNVAEDTNVEIINQSTSIPIFESANIVPVSDETDKKNMCPNMKNENVNVYTTSNEVQDEKIIIDGPKEIDYDVTVFDKFKNYPVSFTEYMHAWKVIATHIDFKHNGNKDDMIEQNYLYCYNPQYKNDGKLIASNHYHFKSNADRQSFINLMKKVNPVEYCISANLHDKRLYELCCIMSNKWFDNNNNLWKLAGFLYTKQHAVLDVMRKTYLTILSQKTERFHYKQAMATFDEWKTSKYPSTLNETNIKSIAAGTNIDSYNEWKDEYEPKEIKIKDVKPSIKPDEDNLRSKLLAITKDTYRRAKDGVIYKKCLPYYYTHKYDNPTDFINDIFIGDEMFSKCTTKQHTDLIYFIKNIAHHDFEFMKIDYNYIGFKNGVYDLSTATFILVDDIDSNIQVRKFINQDFKILDKTPLLDSYFASQFNDDGCEEIIEFIYFMLGRTLTKLDDKFDFMLMIHGEAGSGKSVLLNLVKYLYHHNQIGIFGTSYQNQFGASELCVKQAIICDDMPVNIAKTLPKSDFLSMMTRGPVSCPVKGKSSIQVHDWNLPFIMNGNNLPNYTDLMGEIVRRVMIIKFENIINENERNTELESDIISYEISTFLHRCRSTYLRFKHQYKGKGVESFCPPEFIENRNFLRMATNTTYQFISEMYEYAEGKSVNVSELNQDFKSYIKNRFDMKINPKENINVQSILNVDKGFVNEVQTVCKHCQNKHLKACCSKYNRVQRTTKNKILNITRKY
jgi:energy-coupling factor transporter ATP-binding protein EcfA2